jgi:hypothetical protein
VAKQLVQVMEQKKLDAIAAKLPAPDGHYVAAMYFANVQLLVVSGQYPVPQLHGSETGRQGIPRHLHGAERYRHARFEGPSCRTWASQA